MRSPLLLLAAALTASLARAQWNQFSRCLTSPCVTFVLSFTGMQPDTWWSLGTTIPANAAVVAALNNPANGVNLGDITPIVAGTQTVQVGNNLVLVQRMDNNNLIWRAPDPAVPGSLSDPNAGSFNGPQPGSASAAALLATTNVYYQYSGATTVAEANLIGSRIAANKVRVRRGAALERASARCGRPARSPAMESIAVKGPEHPATTPACGANLRY